MGIDISAFRAEGERLVLDRGLMAGPSRVQTAPLSFRDRVVAWRQGGSLAYGNIHHQQQNRDFKAAFYMALVKAEGPEIANRAMAAGGLRRGWAMSSKPLDQRTRLRILDQAQHFRERAVADTRRNFRTFMRGAGPGSFAHSFSAMATANGYPAGDVRNRALCHLVAREVGRDPRFAKRTLTQTQLDGIARLAIAKFYDQRQAAFREQHEGLAQFAAAGLAGTPREDARTFFAELTAKLSPGMAAGHPLSTEPPGFRQLAARTLEEVRTTTPLMGRMAYEPQGWDQLDRELRAKFQALAALSGQLQNLAATDQPGTADGQQLQQALVQEIRHQQGLISAKLNFLDDIRQSDTLSKKQVAYSNLMWAHAAGQIIEDAKDWLRANPPPGGTVELELQLDRAKVDLIRGAQTAYDRAPTNERTVLPDSGVRKEEHPVKIAQKEAKRFLEATLQQAGLPPEQIRRLTSGEEMDEARRLALNNNQSWAPASRRMVVHKDGVTRTYESAVVPAISINARLRRRYLSSQPLEPGGPPHQPRYGTSSGTKNDPYHARNLKLSTLERILPNGLRKRMATVVGHGVLDQWDITDPQQRRAANRRGAKEVIETAFATNDRVSTEALNRRQAGDNRPVKITHLSVNLVTPSKPRDLLIAATARHVLPHHMEARYTDEQFAAFQANTNVGNGGQPLQLQVDDTRPGGGLGQDVNVNVDVDTIAFSFAINPLATGRGIPDWAAGWTHVYEQNRQSMVRFIGDLGAGGDGSYLSKPGGFIGSVHDRLDNNDPQQRELAAQIREQTDIVRKMFLSEDFKRGDGDPAKMGRHLLYLQGLAEQALDLLGDTGQAATASKGCKSDKDRGGVTDVELKHMAITEDMGGRVLPNQRLEQEDEDNYAIVAVGSEQDINQKRSIGVPGSKEQGKLETRLPDPHVQRLVKGLATFGSE
jgi:phosphatidylinositol-4,5-bisphosphate 4-phosphatase